MHLAGYAPVKSGRVDHYCEIGMATIGLGDQAIEQSIDLAKMTDNLSDSDYSERLGVHHGVAPIGTHAFTANSEEFR